MNSPTALHQLGLFIFSFQHVENRLKNLIALIAGDDEEATQILINYMEYNQLIKTIDVLFARYINIHKDAEKSVKDEFHNLMVDLGKLGERRNELVHSHYFRWIDIEGREGLLRQNSKLSRKAGISEETEEELQPNAFDNDLKKLENADAHIESFRLQVIDCLYPVDRA
ncbi:MAG: hypothetical protein IPQ13_13870 [Holophagaceae bacterium]|nr:hypothetical protein [Holophagaceae bacterium]